MRVISFATFTYIYRGIYATYEFQTTLFTFSKCIFLICGVYIYLSKDDPIHLANEQTNECVI
jgi:hypothetical protein